MWETITSGTVWHGELVNKRKDGTFYTEEMTITPVRSQSGSYNQLHRHKTGCDRAQNG